MEANITLETLISSYSALERLGNREGIRQAPSWWIAKMLRMLKPDYESFQEKKQLIIEKYGTPVKLPDAAGNMREGWQVKPGNESAFRKEIQPILDIETILIVTKHSVAWLGVADSIEPEILYRLSWLLEREEKSSEELTQIRTTRKEAEEAFQAFSAAASYRMPENLSWWVADVLSKLEPVYRETVNLRQELIDKHIDYKDKDRQLPPEYRRENDLLGKEKVTVVSSVKKLSDFGNEITEKWPPVMVSAMIPFLEEPLELPEETTKI